MRLTMITAAVATTLAACAPTPSDIAGVGGDRGPERRCFSVDQVQNFRQGGVGRLYVRATGDVFQIDSGGGCSGLDFAQQLAIVPDGGGLGGSRVCTFDSVLLAVPGAASGTDVCRARITRVLTDEEVAALPSRERP